MPLVIESGRVPRRWAERVAARPLGARLDLREVRPQCLTLAFVNNMPDTALEATELQFFELIDAASEDIPVVLKLYSLPGVPRSVPARRHLDGFYFGISDLWDNPSDALIVTGTEPQRTNLRDEPYWTSLADVFDWGAENTLSTVLSCLAAHASVLHSHGIQRHPLVQKRCGIFDHDVMSDHWLVRGAPDRLSIPHSRWNEVRRDELTQCGYTVLTESADAGVDLFVKQHKRSLFLHFQGHPEYAALTLLKEYRRDIGRFLRRERDQYPSMPQGYFDAAATRAMTTYQETVSQNRSEDLFTSFPETLVADTLENSWRASALRIFRTWLLHIAAEKAAGGQRISDLAHIAL